MADPARQDESAPTGTQCGGILPRDTVRVLGQPALIDSGGSQPEHSSRSISVVPLLDGHRIAGFEVRCGCGTSTIVECVYTTEAPND